MSYSIVGRSAIARPRSSGPGAPSASPAGSIIGKSAIARPCPDGPGAPSGDKSGYSVTGSALWRSPCDELLDLCGITDTFTRTVASGWGCSDAGIAWVTPYAAVSVDGSRGMLLDSIGGGYATVSLPLVLPGDIGVLVDFAVFGTWSSFKVRFWSPDSAAYMTVITFEPSDFDVHLWVEMGSPSGWYSDIVSADPDYLLEAETVYRMRVLLTGPHISVRVWPASGSEPATWQIDHDYAYQGVTPISAGCDNFQISTNGGYLGPNWAVVDNLDITGVDRCTCGITDTFTRTAADGWGTSDAGLAWSTYPGEGPVSVESGYAVMGTDNTVYSGYNWAELPGLPGFAPNMRYSHRFKIETWEPNSGSNVLFMVSSGWQYPGPRTSRLTWMVNANGVLSFDACYGLFSNRAIASNSNFPIEVGAWYNVRAEQDWKTQARLKVWKDGTTEPTAWTLTVDISSQADATIQMYGGSYFAYFDCYDGSSESPAEVWWDDLNICGVNRCTAP